MVTQPDGSQRLFHESVCRQPLRISEQNQSGQTVAAFGRDRGLQDSLFYDWKRLREGETAKFVEVKVVPL
jgi:hypothetical protein